MHTQQLLLELVTQTPAAPETKSQFIARLGEGYVSRDENPHSHFCVYFAALDPVREQVFIGHHRKSGLWLFNGGHLDRDEDAHTALRREIQEEWGVSIPKLAAVRPSLLTTTNIENPQKQTCKKHFDIWFFIQLDRLHFSPKEHLLTAEFYTWGWRSIDEASRLMKDPASITALRYSKQLFLASK
jgi:8-oxo-dGTP pyrophosphatase MutT (NUDIX family)